MSLNERAIDEWYVCSAKNKLEILLQNSADGEEKDVAQSGSLFEHPINDGLTAVQCTT